MSRLTTIESSYISAHSTRIEEQQFNRENHIALKKMPKKGITLPPIYCLPDVDVQRRDFLLSAYYILL